ncbi:MAG: flagellar assembly protein FliX, partial [Rhodospirillales bacterium]
PSVEDATQRSRRSRTRADALLDRLDEIRAALLSGILPRETLSTLADLIGSARDEVDDPGLRAILDEVDLRAQVELAKLDQLT